MMKTLYLVRRPLDQIPSSIFIKYKRLAAQPNGYDGVGVGPAPKPSLLYIRWELPAGWRRIKKTARTVRSCRYIRRAARALLPPVTSTTVGFVISPLRTNKALPSGNVTQSGTVCPNRFTCTSSDQSPSILKTGLTSPSGGGVMSKLHRPVPPLIR